MELPRRPSTWSFSTRGLTADGYARALRGLLERGTLPMEPLPGYAPQVDILRWAIEDIGVLVANLAGVRHFATSNVKEFRDDIFVSVNLAGHCVVTQGRKELPMQSGEAVLFSSAEADFAAVRATPMEFLGLRLPYRALAPLARNLDDTLMRVVPVSETPMPHCNDHFERV